MPRVKYTKEILENAVKNSLSVAGVMKLVGLKCCEGGAHAHVSKKINFFGIDCSHFLGAGTNSGVRHKGGLKKRSPKEVFVLREFTREKADVLTRCLIESSVKYECSACHNDGKWMSSNLILEVDHINRNPLDNRIENLRFLCPNCHSQTVGYNRNKLVKESKHNITDEMAASIVSIPIKTDKKLLPKKVKIVKPDRKCIKCGKIILNRGAKRFCSQKCSQEASRVSTRPPWETLKKELEEMPMTKISEKYRVSDNAIRKMGCSIL